MRDDVTATLSAAQMNVLMHSHLEWKSSVHRRHAKKFPFSGYETPLRQEKGRWLSVGIKGQTPKSSGQCVSFLFHRTGMNWNMLPLVRGVNSLNVDEGFFFFTSTCKCQSWV